MGCACLVVCAGCSIIKAEAEPLWHEYYRNQSGLESHTTVCQCVLVFLSHLEYGALHAGEGEARSPEGQVKQLLQDAQNPHNLSRMYLGWAPWL